MGILSNNDGKKRTASEKANRFTLRMFCRVVACGYIGYLINNIRKAMVLDDPAERMPKGFAIPVLIVFGLFLVLFIVQVIREIREGIKDKKFTADGWESDFDEEYFEGELFDQDDFDRFLNGEGELAELAAEKAARKAEEEAGLSSDEVDDVLCEEDDEMDEEEDL